MKKNIFILLILIYFVAFSQSVQGNEVIVIAGHSQAGKSSFVQAVCSGQKIDIGDYSGVSTTKKVQGYDNCVINQKAYTIIDIPGFFDSTLALSDEEVLLQIQLFLHKMKAQNIKILLFDSLILQGSLALQSLAKLQRLFGQDVVNSIVLVQNMKNAVSDEQTLQFRVSNITQRCKAAGITTSVVYSTPCSKYQPGSASDAAQRRELEDKLSSVKSFTYEEMDRVQAAIRAIAEQLRQTEKRKINNTRTVQKVGVKVDKVPESYQEPIPFQTCRGRGGIRGLFGGRRCWTEYRLETRHRIVEKEIPYPYEEQVEEELLVDYDNEYYQNKSLELWQQQQIDGIKKNMNKEKKQYF